MSQTISEIASKELWVLVSQLKENTDPSELDRITPSVLELISNWAKGGKFIWSGPFGDESGGMAVFEGTQNDAAQFGQRYGDLCSGVLNYYIYKWDVMWGSK